MADALITPEALFTSLLDLERRITLADERFGVAVLGDRAKEDTRKILTAIAGAAATFAQRPLPLPTRRRRRR